MVLTGTAFDILWSTVCVCEVATVVSVIRFVKRFTTASPSSPCLPPPCRQLMQKSKVLEDDVVVVQEAEEVHEYTGDAADESFS